VLLQKREEGGCEGHGCGVSVMDLLGVAEESGEMIVSPLFGNPAKR
jgi:hypothetical protein